MDLDDLDECIMFLKDEVKRQIVQTDFQKFSKQLDIILPDPTALPFVKDLRRLGKILIGARNLFRDEQLTVAAAGEKVRQLIEEHVYSTGVNSKIKPIHLLAENFEEEVNKHKSSKSKAADIEYAIKHHIKINIEEDPEYYKTLSQRLEDLIQKHAEKWDELVQILMDFRDDIEKAREQGARDLGLTETEFAFYNVLFSEITKNQTTKV